MEADIITYKEKDKYERLTRIYLFNPQEGYVVWVHGSYQMPVDELKKVADHLTVTRIGDSKPQYSTTDRKFFWRTMDVGEVLEYELLFVIDEDLMEENVVLSFWASDNSGTIYPDSVNGVYHAIKNDI